MRIGIFLLGLALLAGCSSPPLQIDQQARTLGLEARVERHAGLAVQTLQPVQGARHLRVYLEGDGRAWATPRSPSTDPTPGRSLVLELLALDQQPAVYMARPCQFVMSAPCRVTLWTDARYSPVIIEASSAALDAIKLRLGVDTFELVGHSGGAAVALLLAQRRSDVVAVQTLAGNLAPHRWTQLKRLSPLRGSLDPSDEPGRLRDLPQRHLLGTRDPIIPQELLNHYWNAVQPRCAQRINLDADHHQGYAALWQQLMSEPLPCQSK